MHPEGAIFDPATHGQAEELAKLSVGGDVNTQLLAGILQQLQNLNPRDSGGQRFDDHVGVANYGIAELDITSAQTTTRLLVGPTYRLTLIQVPEVLTTLEVRLFDPNGTPIDMLRSGPVLLSDVPIKDIFITTVPAIPDGGTLRFLTGNVQVSGQRLSNFGCLPTCPQVFELVSGQQNDVDFATETLDGPKRYTMQQDRTSTAVFVRNIPAGTPFRIYGRVSSEDETTTVDKVKGSLQLVKSPDKFWEEEFDGMIGGPQKWLFDTGWGWLKTDNCNMELVIEDVGPTGNILSCTMAIEIVPQL